MRTPDRVTKTLDQIEARLAAIETALWQIARQLGDDAGKARVATILRDARQVWRPAPRPTPRRDGPPVA